MKIPTYLAHLKGFRFPREIISYALRAYHRFALSAADVEDLLAERGIIVSRETVRNGLTVSAAILLTVSNAIGRLSLINGISTRW